MTCTGKDLVGRDYGLNKGIISAFAWRDCKKTLKPQLKQQVTWLKFKPSTSEI
jgi:hypothetical protein